MYACVIVLCSFLWRPSQNNNMKSQHSAYSRERELQRRIFSVLRLSYIFCLEYFWRWYTNWMNLNSCEIRRLNIKCPWHCCRCCLNFCLHFGPSACSVACVPMLVCFSLVCLLISIPLIQFLLFVQGTSTAGLNTY